MDIEQRRLSDADIQSLSLPVQNDLTAIFGVMQDATDRLLDTAVKEGWTPDEYIAAVMRMIDGDNTAQETTAAPEAQEIRVNKSMGGETMPVSKPKSGEKENDYVSRVIGELIGAGKPKDQAAAIAHSTYRENVQKARSVGGFESPEPGDIPEKDAGIGVIDPEELRMGTKEEMEEHNLPLAGGMKIALDHLRKRPDYYSAMKKAGF